MAQFTIPFNLFAFIPHTHPFNPDTTREDEFMENETTSREPVCLLECVEIIIGITKPTEGIQSWLKKFVYEQASHDISIAKKVLSLVCMSQKFNSEFCLVTTKSLWGEWCSLFISPKTTIRP